MVHINYCYNQVHNCVHSYNLYMPCLNHDSNKKPTVFKQTAISSNCLRLPHLLIY